MYLKIIFHKPHCAGVAGILEAYWNIVGKLRFAGPTHFAPVSMKDNIFVTLILFEFSTSLYMILLHNLFLFEKFYSLFVQYVFYNF